MNFIKRIISCAICACVAIGSVSALGAVTASADNESEFRHFYFAGEAFSSDDYVDLWYSVGNLKKMAVNVDAVSAISGANTIKLWAKLHKGNEYTENMKINVFTEEHKWSNDVVTLSDEDMAKLTGAEGYTVNIKNVVDRFNDIECENYTISDMVLEFELPGKDLPDDDSEPVEKVVKKKNPMKVKVKNTVVISAKTLKKKSYRIKKVYTVKNAVGRVISPSVKMSKGMGSMATVYTNGDIYLRNGNYKKRVYMFILKIKAEGNDEYKPKTLYVTFRVKIK